MVRSMPFLLRDDSQLGARHRFVRAFTVAERNRAKARDLLARDGEGGMAAGDPAAGATYDGPGDPRRPCSRLS